MTRGMRRQIPILLLSLFLPATAARGQVRINEILFVPDDTSSDPNRNRQWVELFNAGSGPVNLSGYSIGNRNGRSGARPVAGENLPGGGYRVVPFDVPFFNEESDEAALYSPDAIVDFMAWASNTVPYRPGTAHNDGVAAGIWTRNSHLNRDRIAWTASERFGFVKPGESIGRSPDSTDSSHPLDFYSGGGMSAFGVTPGRRNYDPLPVVLQPPATAVAAGGSRAAQRRAAEPAQQQPLQEREWTVFLYFMGDDPTLTQALAGNLREIAAAGGSTGKVNYLVLFDWVQGRFYQPNAAEPELVFAPEANGTYYGRILGLDAAGRVMIEGPPIEEVNSADDFTLGKYVEETRRLYPAKKLALIIGSHGDGWKGLGRDMMSRQERDWDRLYLKEATNLPGADFDLLVFDACLMAGIEVADAAASAARYMVASEDAVPATGLAYDRLAETLRDFSEETGEQIGRRMLRHFRDRYGAGVGARLGGSLVLSVIDLTQVRRLVIEGVNPWSEWLHSVTRLIRNIEDQSDNVQLFLREHATDAQRFYDQNFVDLRDFAERVMKDTRIPGCGSDRGAAMLSQLERVVLQQTRLDSQRPGANGLHIHFPLYRTWPGRQTPGTSELGGRTEPYDFPTTRLRSGDSSHAVYAKNKKLLPAASRDQEGISGNFLAPRDWPSIPLAGGFLAEFSDWDEFLDAFYHPVAAATIVPGPFVLGFVANVGECENFSRFARVPVGATVRLSGDGSSDADMPPGGPPTPLHYRWDLKPLKDCEGDCVHANAVNDGGPAPGSLDAFTVATDNMDQDRNIEDTTIDDLDASGVSASFTCESAGDFPVYLHVIDDSHLSPFHNNFPSGRYLRFQSSTHFAVIRCVPGPVAGVRFGATGLPPFNQDGDAVGVGVGLIPPSGSALPDQPVQVTPGTRVRSANVNGVTIAPNTTGTVYSNPRGELRIQFVLGDPPGPGRTALRLAEDPPGIATIGFAAGAVTATLPFRYVPRLAPLPTQMIVTPPAGTLVIGRDYDVILEARLNNQPLQDAVFTLQSFAGGLEFTNGTLFNGNRSNQVRAPAGGRTFARFRPTAPGPLEIEVFAGQLHQLLKLNVEGAAQAPTYIDTTAVPRLVKVGEEATAVITLYSRLQPVPNSPVLLEVVGGTRQTLTTNAQGRIEYKLKPANPTPVELRLSVPGANLSTTVWMVVEPPLDPPPPQ